MHNTLVGLNLRHRTRLGCAGKVISAFDVARMIAGHCPTGVTTQDPRRQKALVVPDKAERIYYRFHQTTLAALKELVQAAGLTHPRQISASHIVRCTGEQEICRSARGARARTRRPRRSDATAARKPRGAPVPARGRTRSEKAGVADTQHRAGAALPGLNLDTLLIDLHLEDGAALSLVRTLRERQADRPKSCRWPRTPATRCCSPPCARAPMPYLLESDLPIAASLLRRMVAGKASMAAPVALQTCNSSTSRHWRRVRASQKSLRAWG